MQNSNIRKMSVMAMLVALLVVCSQISVPVGSVPVTAQPLAIMLIGLLLSPKYAVATVLVWVLAGGVGLPFFANFKSGFGVLLGANGRLYLRLHYRRFYHVADCRCGQKFFLGA